MREIGINVSPDVIYGVKAFMECLAKTGFQRIFTTGNDEEFIKHICDICRDTGLKYESLHAPWDHINDLWSAGEPGVTEITVRKLYFSLRSVEMPMPTYWLVMASL